MLHYVPRSLYKSLTRANLVTARFMSMSNDYTYILASRPDPAVTLITLNRPKALNALCSPLFAELNHALLEADNDSEVSAIVITGSERAFAGQWYRVYPHPRTCGN